MPLLGSDTADMGYSDPSFALILQLYLLPDGEKGQRPGPEGPRN
jgi:hypothetical protein